MKDKILDILGSIRFYIVTFAWLADYLGLVADSGFDIVVLLNQLGLWLGSVVVIGSADSVATKFSGKK